jgi:hypothetical protein
MKAIHGTIFSRKDLSEQYADVPFEDVKPEMFSILRNGVGITDDVLIFMDDDGRSKIMKNRYGKAQIS